MCESLPPMSLHPSAPIFVTNSCHRGLVVTFWLVGRAWKQVMRVKGGLVPDRGVHRACPKAHVSLIARQRDSGVAQDE